MKTNFENFIAMGTHELVETNGGGFAHDAGRILRFIALAFPGNPVSLANAITDWQVNALEV